MTVTIEGISFINVRPIRQALGSAELTVGQHMQGMSVTHRMGPEECRQLGQNLLQIAALAYGQPTDDPKQGPQLNPGKSAEPASKDGQWPQDEAGPAPASEPSANA